MPRWGAATFLVMFAACVNNYVVDESGDESSGHRGTDSGGAETSGGGTRDGTSQEAGGSTAVVGDVDSDPTSGGMSLESCQPCEHDTQCGREFDLCVTLSPIEIVCLRLCSEGPEGCRATHVCLPQASVDGEMLDQCTPISGTCVPR